jgi:hypothetical protein
MQWQVSSREDGLPTLCVGHHAQPHVGGCEVRYLWAKIEKEESRIIRFHHNTEIKKYDPSSGEYKVVQFRYADISQVPQDYVETTTVCLTEKCCKNMENAHGGVITGVVIPHDAHEHLGQAKYSLVKGRLQSILSTEASKWW